MGKIRRKIAFFTIPEYEKEQDWLEKQHRNGWKLVNATLKFITITRLLTFYLHICPYTDSFTFICYFHHYKIRHVL